MASLVMTAWTLLVAILFLSYSTFALPADGEGLLNFRSRTVDRLGKLDNWGGTVDPCSGNVTEWFGVRCDNGMVFEIALRSSFLGGELNSSLAELSGLQGLRILDLTDNLFSGPFPETINRLPYLLELSLGDNSLTGSQPSGHSWPPLLQLLELANNGFEGKIDLAGLHELQRLDIGFNSFSGEIFDSDIWLDDLRWLAVVDNQLNGTLPLKLGNLGNLIHIDLSRNRFSGVVPMGEWTYEYVDLSDNMFEGRIPSGIFSNATRYFNCSYNLLSGKLSTAFEEYNKTENDWPFTLDLSNNKLQGPIPRALSQMTGLRSLCLQNNKLTGSIESILKVSFRNPSLFELRLGGNKLSRGGRLNISMSEWISNFPRLEIMDVRASGVDGYILKDFELKFWIQFRILDLSNNQMEGFLPVDLLQMPTLEDLHLQGNNLKFQGDVRTKKITFSKFLRVLDLSDNKLTLPASLLKTIMEKSSSLRELRLGSNTIVGWLPEISKHLRKLEILDLQNSRLVGAIPDQYSDANTLPALKYLDLSNNYLVGPVSEGFKNMSSLVHLDLSNNKLSGQLPDLPLMLLNGSFFSNNHLCGLPLERCPSGHPIRGWLIAVVLVCCVTISGSVCLCIGWAWRRRVDAEARRQDIELIEALLDRDTTTLMSLPELRKATNDFSPEHEIGAGGFGVVYRGVLEDESVVAIKRSRHDGSTSEDKFQFLNEVKILSQVHHRNLVRLLGCCLANKNALLVFEFVSNGTLQEHLQKERGEILLTWDQRLQIAIQTSSALDYLHTSASPPIYHLDVKSANILLDDSCNAKVADFGISKLVPAADATHITMLGGFQGTFGYMDPESVVSSRLTDKSDVYAFGVVMLELITAQPAVDRSRGDDVSLVKWALSLLEQGNLEDIMDPHIFDFSFHSANANESIMEVARLAQHCLKFLQADRPAMKDVTKELMAIQQRRKKR